MTRNLHSDMVFIKMNRNLNERALVASCKASPALPCRLSHLEDGSDNFTSFRRGQGYFFDHAI